MEPTASSNPNLGPDASCPASPRHGWTPGFLQGPALDPRNHGADTHDDVQGDDDEPDEALRRPRGKPQQSHCKSRLGPHNGRDRDGCATTEDDEERADVCVVEVEIPTVPAELELADQDGGQHVCSHDGDLSLKVSNSMVDTEAEELQAKPTHPPTRIQSSHHNGRFVMIALQYMRRKRKVVAMNARIQDTPSRIGPLSSRGCRASCSGGGSVDGMIVGLVLSNCESALLGRANDGHPMSERHRTKGRREDGDGGDDRQIPVDIYHLVHPDDCRLEVPGRWTRWPSRGDRCIKHGIYARLF